MPMVTTNTIPIGPSNPDGKTFGASPSDPIGFHGATPSVQASSPLQAAVPTGASGFGNAAGAVTVYNSTQSPTGIATITVAEQSLTVTGVLATDLVLITKPTTQAGIAMCQPRVSAANTVRLVLGNPTGGTLTPTGSEAYIVTTIAANLQLSAVLSPAAVPANAVSEQTFTLSGAAVGLAPGMLVAVNKPTTQAGLGVMYARVVANNQIAIGFANFTAAPITPTASETYIIAGINALMPVSALMNFGINVGTLSGVATITSAEQAVTEAGIAATDVLVGVTKPSQQAGLALVGGRVSAAATVRLSFCNPTVGTLTPTGSEVYGVTVYRPSPGALLSIFSASITPSSVAANTSAEQTFAVPGIVSGQPIYGCPQGNFTAGGAVAPAGIRASAAGQIAINFVNVGATAVTPPSLTWLIGQVNQTLPTAGNFVSHCVTPVQTSQANLLAAIRAAAVGKGLIAGA